MAATMTAQPVDEHPALEELSEIFLCTLKVKDKHFCDRNSPQTSLMA
jgi:hypothetical protein